MGRTNAERSAPDPGAREPVRVESLELQKKKRRARQVDADGELPVSIGHDPSLPKSVVAKNQPPSVSAKQSGDPAIPYKGEVRALRRRLREVYAKIVGGPRPQSAADVQDQLANELGILVPDEVASDLASMARSYHRPANKPAEDNQFQQVYGNLQLALEQKEKLLMKALRQRVYEAEEGQELNSGQQKLPLLQIRSAMVEFGIAEDTMLDAVLQAFRNDKGDDSITLAELRSAIAGIKDPSSPFSKHGWRDKLCKSFEQVSGCSSTQNLGLSNDQKAVYSHFLDHLMPVLEKQVDFVLHSASFVRRRKSGTGKRPAPTKCMSAEPGLFGGPSFRMPTIMESGSAPVMRLAELRDKSNTKITSHQRHPRETDDQFKNLIQQVSSPTKSSVRPSTQSSSASSCWSEFRERVSPFRAPKLSMADILPADKKMIDKEDQWKTVSQLEVEHPGSGLAGETQKAKAIEDRFFKKIENIQKARENVDGRAHADLKKFDQRYENRLSNMADIRGSIEAKVQAQRKIMVGLGNVMIPSGNLDHQSKFREAQIYEGPAMEAKREARRTRERIQKERRELAWANEDENKERLLVRQAENAKILAEKQAKDKQKEDEVEKFIKNREEAKLKRDAKRKEDDGWSIENALKGIPTEVSKDCDLLPDGFTQESIKEERRINGIMREHVRYKGAVEGMKQDSDKRRSRLTRMLWGENPDLDLPGKELQYVSPPKRKAKVEDSLDEVGTGNSKMGMYGDGRGSRMQGNLAGETHRFCFGDTERALEGGRDSRNGGRDSRNGGRDSRNSIYGQGADVRSGSSRIEAQFPNIN
jgi:hypothetical protein